MGPQPSGYATSAQSADPDRQQAHDGTALEMRKDRNADAGSGVERTVPICGSVWRLGADHMERTSNMSRTATRILFGFAAGFLSHLIFQGALGAGLYAAHLAPALPWSLKPVPPFGIPLSLNLGFWAGLWGVAYALLEPRLTDRLGRWPGGVAFGLAGPLLVFWFVILPIKGLGLGGGFHAEMVPIHVAFHAVFGLGLAVFFRSGLALVQRRARPFAEPLRG
ncbi:MAG TPA: hypothetical protein VHL98_11465 [Microvirga sp.]|jgi:hypothetical protein|nr:hypothetical protein [Microvirga sp.]